MLSEYITIHAASKIRCILMRRYNSHARRPARIECNSTRMQRTSKSTLCTTENSIARKGAKAFEVCVKAQCTLTSVRPPHCFEHAFGVTSIGHSSLRWSYPIQLEKSAFCPFAAWRSRAFPARPRACARIRSETEPRTNESWPDTIFRRGIILCVLFIITIDRLPAGRQPDPGPGQTGQ